MGAMVSTYSEAVHQTVSFSQVLLDCGESFSGWCESCGSLQSLLRWSIQKQQLWSNTFELKGLIALISPFANLLWPWPHICVDFSLTSKKNTWARRVVGFVDKFPDSQDISPDRRRFFCILPGIIFQSRQFPCHSNNFSFDLKEAPNDS